MESLGWILGGAVCIAVGLAAWVTAFILLPAGAILIVIGAVKAVRTTRMSRSGPSGS
jgi:hypothetical protein